MTDTSGQLSAIATVSKRRKLTSNQDSVPSPRVHAATTALEESSPSGSDTQYQQLDIQLSAVTLSSSRIKAATSTTLTVTLKQGESLAVIGLYDFWVKEGCVSLLGARVSPSKRLLRVYAPSTHSLPTIICEGAPYAEIAILSCQGGIQCLRKTSPLFSHIWNAKHTSSVIIKGTDVSRERSFSVLYRSSEDPRKRHLSRFDATLFKAVQSLSAILKSDSFTSNGMGARVMVCGPKATGKSSLCQYLINRFVTEGEPSPDKPSSSIALLDLDPGQPFFCAPGHIVLSHLRAPWFGPAFAHPTVIPESENEVLRAHLVGAVSLRSDPSSYIQYVMNLLSHYERLLETFPACPLVINTPAWVTGAGLETMTELVVSLRITNLIFTSTDPLLQDPFRIIAEKHNFRFIPVGSASSERASRSPKDLQTMQMITYFHLARPDRSGSKWYRTPLYLTRPWVVQYSGEKQGISAVILTNEQRISEFLFRALEGSIVSVMVLEDATVFEEPLTEGRNFDQEVMQLDEGCDASIPSIDLYRCPTTNIPFAPRLPPSTSSSLGLALVRTIDIKSQQIHLTTPISTSVLVGVLRENQRIALALSNFEVPEWAFQEDGWPEWAWSQEQVPYVRS